ncbi:hypothetical protein E2C01_000851 [Portunus trituberculatus]|uniref:Uncharacterized protein n=1 Tax=Portunus trituberculatus TaxID=210409 RepID=A0A5B7CG55_PORTR|nr:hypothetical protein [Portunus trituberculatus]
MTRKQLSVPSSRQKIIGAGGWRGRCRSIVPPAARISPRLVMRIPLYDVSAEPPGYEGDVRMKRRGTKHTKPKSRSRIRMKTVHRIIRRYYSFHFYR